MKTLIPEKDVPRTEHANEVWTPEEDDALLDAYLAGGSPGALAAEFKRKPKAIIRRIDYYRDNERDWVINYKPVDRISRKGKRLTSNEKLIIAAHRAKKIALYLTARVLARDVSEIEDCSGQVADVKNLKVLAPTLDLIWAYRYIHFVYKRDLICNSAYDKLVDTEIEYGGGLLSFEAIKEHRGWPDHIKCLALYLVGKRDAQLAELGTAGTSYTVGEKEGLYAGPFATLKEARAWDGKNSASRIYETKGSHSRAVGRWLVDEQRWEMRE